MRQSRFTLCIVVGTIAGFSLLLFVYGIGFSAGYEASPTGNPTSDFDYYHWLNRLHFAITIGLAVITVGLWLKHLRGLVIAGIGSVCVLAIYGWWFARTKAYILNSEATEYTKLHDPSFSRLVFLGAIWWDFVVLVVAFLLLGWVAIAALRSMRTQRSA
jgi:hypothetical protein